MTSNKQFPTNRVLSLLLLSGALSLAACGGTSQSGTADTNNLAGQETTADQESTTDSNPTATETQTTDVEGNTAAPTATEDGPETTEASATRLPLKKLYRSVSNTPVFNAEKSAHNFVIRNSTRWETVWSKLQMENKDLAPMPVIDFNTKQVIGIQRTLNNSCLDGFIASASQRTENTLVRVQIAEPKPGTKCAEALRYSLHFVETDKTTTEVLFNDVSSQEMILRRAMRLTSSMPFSDINMPYQNHVINTEADWMNIEQKLKTHFGEEIMLPKINWDKKRIIGIEREITKPCMNITMANAIALPNTAVIRVESTFPPADEAKECEVTPSYLTEFKTIDRLPEAVRFRDLAEKEVAAK